jgi:prepilin-type N-terminal cleavage/methylation domain-containing protein
MSRSRPKQTERERGFTLIETVVSIGVLAIGLTAMALLVANSLSGTDRSRYLGLATTLASEKLEDLNRWPENDPNVFVPAASNTAGSLTSDIVQNVTSGAVTEPVSYYDEVLLSSAGGSVSETRTGLDGSGNVQYTTTSHSANGTVTTASPSTTPPTTQGMDNFKRRWIIEKDQPTTGVRRITVLVTLMNQSVQPPVSFQMTMVRP